MFLRGKHKFMNSFNITVHQMLEKWKLNFIKEGISEPKESIEHILAHSLKSRSVSHVYKNKNKSLSAEEVQEIELLCNKRLKKMPLQYIINEWDFRDLTLKMSRPVFIPRPETENLVDLLLNEIDNKKIRQILELCCGSGAISLALLKARPQLEILAVDKSLHACKLTEENALRLNVSERITVKQMEIKDGCSLDEFDHPYEVIVSNPPYVLTKDLVGLQPEILMYEDRSALDGGDDGLKVIIPILKVSSFLLTKGGKLFLEVDPTHPGLINLWCKHNYNSRLSFCRSHKDFCSKERFVEIIKT